MGQAVALLPKSGHLLSATGRLAALVGHLVGQCTETGSGYGAYGADGEFERALCHKENRDFTGKMAVLRGLPYKEEVAGSSPASPITDWPLFYGDFGTAMGLPLLVTSRAFGHSNIRTNACSSEGCLPILQGMIGPVVPSGGFL
jgi:hypothetical protein